MRAPANSMIGSAAFVIDVQKQEDGLFRAFSPSVPELKAVTGETEREATVEFRRVLEEWVVKGCEI